MSQMVFFFLKKKISALQIVIVVHFVRERNWKTCLFNAGRTFLPRHARVPRGFAQPLLVRRQIFRLVFLNEQIFKISCYEMYIDFVSNIQILSYACPHATVGVMKSRYITPLLQ